jgi:hypothetical protein
MGNWLVKQCMFVVTTLIECKSLVQVQRRFRHEFRVDRHSRIHSSNDLKVDGNISEYQQHLHLLCW